MSLQFEAVEMSVSARLAPGAVAYRHSGTIDRCTISVTYTLDPEVHRSRTSAGVGAVIDERLLAALIDLPSGELAVVEPRFCGVFDEPATARYATIIQAPDGQLWGQRRLEPAVRILDIEVEASTWQRGLRAVDAWAGYGPRTVALTRAIADLDVALLEASYFGIGVRESSAGRVVLEPAPYRSRRWTSARWRFAELVYGQFLEASVAAVR